MHDEGAELEAAHLTRLSRMMLSVDARLSRMYGERLRELAVETGTSLSTRQVCERCCMPQVGGVTARVTLAPVSGSRAVQRLRGQDRSGWGEGVVRSKCMVCGGVGAAWGKPKRRRSEKSAAQEAEQKKKQKEAQRKKQKKAKVKPLATQVKTAAAPSYSLDDFLRM